MLLNHPETFHKYEIPLAQELANGRGIWAEGCHAVATVIDQTRPPARPWPRRAESVCSLARRRRAAVISRALPTTQRGVGGGGGDGGVASHLLLLHFAPPQTPNDDFDGGRWQAGPPKTDRDR